jgi:tRNA pseudouridine55 synthase
VEAGREHLDGREPAAGELLVTDVVRGLLPRDANTPMEERAVSLAMLEQLDEGPAGREALAGVLLPVETALHDIPALVISGSDAARLRRGQPVLLRGRDAPIFNGTVYATSRGTLVALGEVSEGELKPRRIFNLPC